jgi:hypothetical protein
MGKLRELHENPIGVLKNKIETLMREEGKITMVTGDFNSDIHRNDDANLYDFITDTGLRHTATSRQLEEFSFHRGVFTTIAATRIDYALLGNMGEAISSQLVPLDSYLADHSILITWLKAQGCRPDTEIMKMPTLIDLKIRNKEEVDIFTEAFQSASFKDLIGTSNNCEELLQNISSFSVQTCAKSRSGSHGKWHLWSPTMMTVIIALRAVTCIRRHVCGYKKYQKWTEATFREGLTKVRRLWRYQLDLLRGTRPPDLTENFMYNWDYFHDVSWHELTTNIEGAFDSLKKKLHGKERSKMRLAYNSVYRNMETNRLAGLLAKVIRPLLGTVREPFTLQTIMENDEVITDQVAINRLVRLHFMLWFQDNRGEPPLEVLHPWMKHETSEEEFLGRHQGSGVPSDILNILWSSMKTKKLPDQTANSLLDPPTLEEFQRAIAHTKANSTGGMSKLTNNMMKCWPEEVVEMVHSALITLWNNDKEIPVYWKWKWLVPIPKVENPSKKDLRPLALVEVLRKAWISIFVKRIQNKWEATRALENTQHGFRPKKGTDTAVAGMINTLETAQEYCSRVLLSSWDLKKAFDSVPKDILVWSWMRLGIPEELALYLVEMDFLGSTVVRTPLTATLNDTNGKLGIIEGGWQFSAELGAGQGDIPSPSNWNALFDMLLKAIRIGCCDDFAVMGACGEAIKPGCIGYADDLIGITGSPAKMQKFADIISGFTILTGLTFSIEKFRAFAINWGNPIHLPPVVITVHTKGWVPQQFTMETRGVMKHLGVHWDMSLDPGVMLKLAKETLQSSCNMLDRKHASPDCKRIAMEMSIHKKIAYYAKYMNCTMAELYKLDVPCNKLIRSMTKNTSNYSTDMLYASTKRGGLNYKRLSDYILKCKFSYWERLTLKGYNEWSTAMGLFTREAKARCDPVIPGTRIELHHEAHSDGRWMSSCAQWLNMNGISLRLNGTDSTGTIDESIPSYLRRTGEVNWAKLADESLAYGMATRGDAVEGDLGEECKVLPRIGQCWMVINNELCEIWEIISFYGQYQDHVAFQVWLTNKDPETISSGDRVRLAEEKGTPSYQGLLATNSYTWDTFLDCINMVKCQVFLCKEKHGKRCTYANIFKYSRRWPNRNKLRTGLGVRSHVAKEGSIIFTDG